LFRPNWHKRVPGLAWPHKGLIELSIRFGGLLQSHKKMFRIDSAESRSILNHH
jgi:hypothetical protein